MAWRNARPVDRCKIRSGLRPSGGVTIVDKAEREVARFSYFVNGRKNGERRRRMATTMLVEAAAQRCGCFAAAKAFAR